MIASAAPPKHASPRQMVQTPAESDHNIIPMAKIAPTAIKTQGFASYRV